MNIYLNENNLLPRCQSAYRKHHFTETAVLKVLSDVYLAADLGRITLLGLLDLSAAFDTVDHQILCDRLHNSFGLGGAVLKWFGSYLTDRSHCIRCNNVTSESALSSTVYRRGTSLVRCCFFFTLLMSSVSPPDMGFRLTLMLTICKFTVTLLRCYALILCQECLPVLAKSAHGWPVIA